MESVRTPTSGLGVEGDREWPQYMLSADDEQAPSTCPITITRAHPKPAAQLP